MKSQTVEACSCKLLENYVILCLSICRVIFCVNTATNSLQKLLPSLSVVAEAKSAAEALMKVISKPNTNFSGADLLVPSALAGEIVLKNVTFSYSSRPSVVVLDSLSMVFKAGCSTAIVGPSGSGKSTLVGIIERWYDNFQGALFLDGRPMENIDVKWLKSRIGLVQQVSMHLHNLSEV